MDLHLTDEQVERLVTSASYRSDNGRGGSSTSGGTGNAPVCCAKWCARQLSEHMGTLDRIIDGDR
jgi:hypothetical protein